MNRILRALSVRPDAWRPDALRALFVRPDAWRPDASRLALIVIGLLLAACQPGGDGGGVPGY